MRLASLVALVSLVSFAGAHAQSVVVNELLASNATTLADPDFGDYGDWIELYNPASTPADLSGYYLTDDFDEPTRWRIPDGTVLAPGGFLVVWTDDEDTGPPATIALHTDFKLSGGGEQVGLFDPVATLAHWVARYRMNGGKGGPTKKSAPELHKLQVRHSRPATSLTRH